LTVFLFPFSERSGEPRDVLGMIQLAEFAQVDKKNELRPETHRFKFPSFRHSNIFPRSSLTIYVSGQDILPSRRANNEEK